MATQTLNFGYETDQAVDSAELFTLGSDTIAYTADSVSEFTNRDGRYGAVFTDVAANDYLLIYYISGTAVGSEYYSLTLITNEFRPWSEQNVNVEALQLSVAEILTKLGSGTVQTVSPVTAFGVIGNIVIGDDYLAANDRAFEWIIDPVTGLAFGDCTCQFGGKSTSTDSWNVTGTVSEVTISSETKWKLSFDLVSADTSALVATLYNWSVEIRGPSTNNITKVTGQVRLVPSYTQ